MQDFLSLTDFLYLIVMTLKNVFVFSLIFAMPAGPNDYDFWERPFNYDCDRNSPNSFSPAERLEIPKNRSKCQFL